ncbi:LamG-like jellyroll fold domain-containing protein [Geodermatophilus pulveris]|uniref:LamG-like jellyroll fold domain-containing protein n=1 Tax=Geodermatophilus pulveris TaxID=1564159 RepID=UPI001FE36F38|nr:LamG-like jellyroll fold domain-containing protein [Geodermatophilus pulveris]
MVAPGTARADWAPLDRTDPATPATVTADPLPTTQINGVAWAQLVVGNKVYVAGEFTRARPAGAAPGTQETARNHLLAYDIRTGQLDTSFAPTLNAQALALAASPDGSRIYVGGDFTRADGQSRYRVAAYSTATGQLVSDFRPAVGNQVRAIAATDSTVYLGGAFASVGSTARNRLAAVSAATGALLPWAPRPGVGSTAGNTLKDDPEKNAQTSNEVLALVVAGSNGQVVAAGRFDSLNGVKATGVGALDGVTGATRPFAVNRLITNQGVNSAVWSLSTDGTSVYGTGYNYYGPGNLEGSFAAEATGGRVRWINDCRGDTYSIFAKGGAAYHATHAHVCDNIGGFPEQNPRVNMYGTAVSNAATGTVGPVTVQGIPYFRGQPAPSVLPWYPTFYSGRYTGQYQAGWTVTGNDDYVVYGGEFPGVNGLTQQGLVRFAVSDIAPDRVGPRTTGTWTPTVSMVPGAARVSWRAVSDRDNEHLTYRVYRDSMAAAPVCAVTRPSQWWTLPTYACSDTAATAGAHRYLVTATDAAGNRVSSTWVTATVGSANRSPSRAYAGLVQADGALQHWPLGEASGTRAYNRTNGLDLTVQSGVTRRQAGAIAGDADTSYAFNGTSSGYLGGTSAMAAPQTFSVEAWFQTTSRAGGRIVGFGNSATGYSSSYDRHVMMDASGRLAFGVRLNGTNPTVTTTGTYNDGRWHHVVGTLDHTGLALYVDGTLIGKRADVTAASRYTGHWRVGGDRSWFSGADWFAGRIDEVAVYPRALSPEQVRAHDSTGRSGTVPNAAPTASFTATPADLTVAVDGAASADADGRVAAHAWDFGDGATGTGATASHTYAAAGTYTVRLTVTDDDGATGTVTRTVTVTAPAPQPEPEPEPGVQPLAADAFERSVTSGWGTADVGGAWTMSGSSGISSVTGGAGQLSGGIGRTVGATLGAVSGQDVAVQAELTLPQAATGTGAWVSLGGRKVGSTDQRATLRFQSTGAVDVRLDRTVDGAETVLASQRLAGTYAPGTALTVRLELAGTALRAKVWPAGTAEPTAWTVTATDTTAALQRPGSLFLEVYTSGSATRRQDLRLDDLWAGQAGQLPPAP